MKTAGRSGTGAVRTSICVTGIVQGVGFRPFIYRLASAAGLHGFVLNTSGGVAIEVEGDAGRIEEFIAAIGNEAPPLARITSLESRDLKPVGESGFSIRGSTSGEGHQLISPDSCTCDDCLRELFDPSDRRYHYPFINCTNCGPRFTIIEGLPYDRPLTTMRRFKMCPTCQAEYDDPGDRRFHAQPNACPDCGPGLWLADGSGTRLDTDDPIAAAAAALREGAIIALKGLGGYQLSCTAADWDAVERLRSRKNRPHKPFALMASNVEEASLYCRIEDAERKLLESAERPVVLLHSFEDGGIAANVAPGLNILGMMLPCAPLHFLLMDAVGEPLVMTSGNMSEEPICRTNTEALSRLSGIADLFLMHNRGIRSTYDDSVVMVDSGKPVMIRRARGYAPLPVKLPADGPAILAAGAELKNSFCLTSGDEAFISQHIGDLENAETLLHLQHTVSLYERIFDTRPERFASDRHPGYLSTAYCLERSPEPLKVQHHRAHIAGCLCENQRLEDVVGIALDGTGFGDDGHIWGGEFFVGGLKKDLQRVAQLDYFPLLGGEAAIHEPWRTALALTWRYAPGQAEFVADLFGIAGQRLNLLLRQLEGGLNCPQTSSCGRLFDAVSALVLRRSSVSFEAQAAMELESAASRFANDGDDTLHRAIKADLDPLSCRFSIDRRSEPWVLSPRRAVVKIIDGVDRGDDPRLLAYQFHMGLADGIIRTGSQLVQLHGLGAVALSGGVFQNRLLSSMVRSGLEELDIEVISHAFVPPNDGGISLGQAAIALFQR